MQQKKVPTDLINGRLIDCTNLNWARGTSFIGFFQ